MNEDTIFLLRECNAGCKSGTNSMEQVIPHINNAELLSLVKEYNDKHIRLGDKCHELLNEVNEGEKDPTTAAIVFSWFSTEMKLLVKDDTHKIADLMVDGCNMGIKSVSKYLNKYKAASEQSKNMAKELVSIEKDFMDKLLVFL